MNKDKYDNPQKPQKPKFSFATIIISSIPGVAIIAKGIISKSLVMILLGLSVIVVSVYIAIKNYKESIQMYKSILKKYDFELKQRAIAKEENTYQNPNFSDESKK